MNMPFITFLLQGIPELIGVVTLAFVISRIPLKWSRIILIGVTLAICSYVVRQLSIPFGIHTILLIILLFIFLTKMGKVDFSLSLIASLLSVIALILFEIVCLSLLMPIFGITPEILLTNPVVRISIAIPQILLLFISAFLLKKIYVQRG